MSWVVSSVSSADFVHTWWSLVLRGYPIRKKAPLPRSRDLIKKTISLPDPKSKMANKMNTSRPHVGRQCNRPGPLFADGTGLQGHSLTRQGCSNSHFATTVSESESETLLFVPYRVTTFQIQITLIFLLSSRKRPIYIIPEHSASILTYPRSFASFPGHKFLYHQLII